MMILPGGGGPFSFGMIGSISAAVGFATALVQVAGCWLLTSPDPGAGEVEGGRAIRLLARYALLATMLAEPLQTTWSSQNNLNNLSINAGVPAFVQIIAYLAVGMGGVQIIGQAAMFVYVRRLSMRLPSIALARQTRIVMCGYIACQVLGLVMMIAFMLAMPRMMAAMGGGGNFPAGFGVLLSLSCVMGVATLTFGVWAIVLMFFYRAAFKRAAHDARQGLDGISTHIPATAQA
jgi:hypothetical protein